MDARAPQRGLARAMVARRAFATRNRQRRSTSSTGVGTSGSRRRRKPCRCQRMTVCGLNDIGALFAATAPPGAREHIQKRRSNCPNRGRSREAEQGELLS